MEMTFSFNCTSLIKKYEGFSPKPYVDPATGAEPITIGFGSTTYEDGTKVKITDPSISETKAEIMLLFHLNKTVLPVIKRYVTVRLNQNQIDALGSFIYNVGETNFKNSTLLKKINSNAPLSEICNELRKWNKANKKVMKGLVLRREAEIKLYSK